MKVLIVAEGRHPDFGGGAETFVRYLARELVGRGHDVHTLTRKPHRGLPDDETADAVHVHRYPGPAVGSALYWTYPLASVVGARRRFAALARRVRFDVIILNQAFSAAGVVSSGRSRGARRLYVFHSASHLECRAALPCEGAWVDAVSSLPLALVKHLERYALRRCDAIVTLSRYVKASVQAIHGEAEARIEVVPGGVDTALFSPVCGPDEKRRLRAAHGVASDAFVVFVAKRLYQGMGVENAIEAVRLLADRNVQLLIAGDGPWRARVEERVARAGVTDRVRLLGSVPYREMLDYYRLSDLFLSTRAEPFGLVMLEALACGLPVASVPGGGGAEILQAMPEGVLGEDASAPAMAGLIRRHVDDRAALHALGVAARRHAEARYAWSVVGERIERLMSR